jgi:threonine dehydratase
VADGAGQITPGLIAGLVNEAYARIKPHLIHTRIVYDGQTGVYLKCENDQHTGSFKWRGALAKLSLFEKGQSIVTASTGNHGLGIANAAKLFGLKARIFIPQSASPQKIEKLQQTGADLTRVEGDSLVAEMKGKEYASQEGLPWVSPYNDPDVISGQGTIGIDLMMDLPAIDKLYVTVGGGGLIAGVAGMIKSVFPNTEIIGCQPQNSPEMFLSIQAGQVVKAPKEVETLSDGSAGPLEEDSITFPLCQQLINRFILVSENEIEEAIRDVYLFHGLVIEGAAGVAYAAAAKDTARNPDDRAVAILCGGNINPVIHQRICHTA